MGFALRFFAGSDGKQLLKEGFRRFFHIRALRKDTGVEVNPVALLFCQRRVGCDQKYGMQEQMHALASLGLLGRFVGMLTDSRSFISYPRHEYFRRILCNMIGEWVENGEYPEDYEVLGELVQGICFNNAVSYFGMEV